MTERTARVVAPAALALFAVLGALMTDRATPGAVAAAAVATGIGVVLAWRRTTGWPMIAGLAIAAGALVFLGHAQSSNLCWMGLCVVTAWVALTSATPVAVASGAVLALVPVVEWRHGHRRAGVGRLVRRHLVHDGPDDLRPSAAARHGGAEGSPGRAGREVPRRGAQPDRRRGARRHRPRAHGVPAAHQQRPARPGRGPAGGASFAPGGRAADPGQPRGGTRHRGPDAYRRPGPIELRCRARATSPPWSSRSVAPAPTCSSSSTSTSGRCGATRGLAAYRIVQEALTNATRHAPGQPVVVQVGPTRDGTTVTVHNDGPPVPAPTPGAGTPRDAGAGREPRWPPDRGADRRRVAGRGGAAP